MTRKRRPCWWGFSIRHWIGRVLTKRFILGLCTYMDGRKKAGFCFMVFVCVERRNGLLIAVHLNGVWKQGSRQEWPHLHLEHLLSVSSASREPRFEGRSWILPEEHTGLDSLARFVSGSPRWKRPEMIGSSGAGSGRRASRRACYCSILDSNLRGSSELHETIHYNYYLQQTDNSTSQGYHDARTEG